MAAAQPVSWTGDGGDGLWSTAANWSPPGIPGSDAEVAIPAGAEVVAPASASVKTLTLDGSLWVRGQSGINTLSVSESFLNRGSLRLESINSSYTLRLSLGSGAVLVNEGTILAAQGTGGGRSILGSVTNRGTITAGSGTAFVVGGSNATVVQETGGILEGIGTLEISGSNALLHLTGGTTTGEVVVDNSDLRVGPGLGEQTVIARGSGPRLLEMESPAVTVWVRGQSAMVTLNTTDGLVNRGTIRLESINSSYTSRLSVLGGGTLVNEGTIEARQGTGGNRNILGNLINRGTLRAGPEFTWSLGQSNRRITLESGGLEGDVIFVNGELAVKPGTAAQTVVVPGALTLVEHAHPGVTVWVRGTSGTLTVDVPDGFINRGTIRLESINSSYTSRLSVLDNGALVNEGVIEARQGTGGNRALNANLVNRGMMRADGIDFSVGNHGRSVVLEEGGVFEGTGGGELVLNSAAVRLVGGEMRSGSRLDGGSLRIEATVPAQTVEALNSFDLLELDNPAVAVWARGWASGNQTIALPDGFVNRGTIRMDRTVPNFSITLSVADNGTFTNEGVIEALPGTGGNRALNANLVNRGTIRADGIAFSVGNNGRSVVMEEGGAFEGTGGGELVLNNAAVRLVGGEMRSGSRLDGGSLRVEATVPAQTVEVLNSFDLLELDNPAVAVWARGWASGNQTIALPDGFVNRGTIRMERTVPNFSITLSVADSGTFTNEGVIEALPGTGGNRTVNAHLVNRGMMRADGIDFSVGNNSRSVVMEDGGAFEGTGGGELVLNNASVRLVGGEMRSGSRLDGGSLRVEAAVPAQVVEVLNSFDLLELDNPAVAVWARGWASGNQTIALPDGFVNRGTIRMERTVPNFSITLSVAGNGTFTNEGVIEALPGTGGGRTLQGSFVNTGTIRSAEDVSFSISRSGATYLNEGVLFADGGSFSFSGASFTNAPDGVIRGIGAVNLGGITLQQNGVLEPGLPGLTGELSFTGAAEFGSSAVTRVRLGGSDDEPEIDRVVFSGAVAINGELSLDQNGIFPAMDASFDVLAYGSRTGEFSALSGTVLAGGLAFSLDYQPTFLRLTAEAADDLGPAVVADAFDGNAVRVRFFDPFGVDADSVADPAHYALARNGAPVPELITGIVYDPGSRWATISLVPGLPVGEYTLTVSGVANLLETPMADPHEVVFQPEDVLDGTRIWRAEGGGDWHDPANWFGRRLPGPEEEALIPAGTEAVTVSQDAGVGRVTAAAPLRLTAGTLTVMEGESHLSAGLIVERLAGLRVTGEGTMFNVFGETSFHGGELLADAGGQMILADLETLHAATGGGTRNRVEANDPGSLIELPAVTFFDGTSRLFRFNALDGGVIRLDGLAVIEGRLTAAAEGAGSLLAMPSLVLWDGQNWNSALEAVDGGLAEIGTGTGFTELKRVFVELTDGGLVDTRLLAINSAGNLRGTGQVTGDVQTANLTLWRASSSRPPDLLVIDGNLTLTPGGETRFRAYSDGVPVVVASGATALAGTFILQNISLSPQVGDSWPVFEYGAVTGAFAEWSGLDVAGGVEYHPAYGPAALVLNGMETVLPQVTEVSPAGPVDRFSALTVTFNKALSNGSVSRHDFRMQTGGGEISANSVSRIAPDRYRAVFPEQELEGVYTLAVGPNIRDTVGNFMAEVHLHQVEIAKPPLPDLVPSAVSAPSVLTAGGTAEVSWTVTNAGTAPLTGTWTETVYLEGIDPVMARTEIASFLFEDKTLSIAGEAERAVVLDLPFAAPHGAVRLVVEVDSGNNLHELFKGNNTASSAAATLPPALRLTSSVTAVKETDSPDRLRPTLTRTGPLNQTLTVDLASSATTEATVPATVTFATWQRSILFSVTPVHDGVVDGDQPVLLTASADSWLPAELGITVLDVDKPQLTLDLDAAGLVEGESMQGRVITNVPATQPLTIKLAANDSTRLVLPATAVIPPGQTEVSFTLGAPRSESLRGDADVRIEASVPGHATGSATVLVVDPKVPELFLELRDPVLRKNGPPSHTILTVRRQGGASIGVDVRLDNSRPDLVAMGTTVRIPAGEGAVSIPVVPRQGADLSGTAEVRFQARLGALSPPMVESAPVFLNVIGANVAQLTLTLNPDVAAPGLPEATLATVTRYPVSGEPLDVGIESNSPNRVAVPSGMVIPAGEASAQFWIETLPREWPEGSTGVSIRASATGHLAGTSVLIITDDRLPDLKIAEITLPSTGFTEEEATATYRIVNRGTAAAKGPFHQRVFITGNPSQPFQYLVAQHTFDGTLPPGGELHREFPFRLPAKSGDYHLFVQTDATGAVRELRTDNNLAAGANTIAVSAAYTATVEAGLENAPAGTPVPLSGTAARAGSGAPAANVPVKVTIRRGGLDRVETFVTNSDGVFSGEWKPVSGESGFYEIAASHPGASGFEAQDSFRLLGLRIDPKTLNARLVEGGPAKVLTVELGNPGNETLIGLGASVQSGGGPVGTAVRFPGGNSLPPGGTLEVEVELTPAASGAGAGSDEVEFTAGNGATATLAVNYRVIRPVAKLTARPDRLERGAVIGQTTSWQILLMNDGGGATGPLELLTSELPWLTLPKKTLPPLAPGESVLFTVTASPPMGTDPIPHSGEILARDRNGGASLSMPFELRLVSEAKGGFSVTVENEFTYFAEDRPLVGGASIELYDYWTGELAASGTTGTDGRWEIPSIAEGYYELEVSAELHLDFTDTIFISAGSANENTVFLNYEAVRYTWEVVEVEFEDRYEVRLVADFETHVPIPVVVVEPAYVDLGELLGDADSAQIDFTITNHGLITAEEAVLTIPELPGYDVELLSEELGDIPALTTLTVPVRISRVEDMSPQSGLVNCESVGRLAYVYVCGPKGMKRVQRMRYRLENCAERKPSPWNVGVPDFQPGGRRSVIAEYIRRTGEAVASGVRNAYLWVEQRVPDTGRGGEPREVKTPEKLRGGRIGNCGEPNELPTSPVGTWGAADLVNDIFNCGVADPWSLSACASVLKEGVDRLFDRVVRNLSPVEPFSLAIMATDPDAVYAMAMSDLPLFPMQSEDPLRVWLDRMAVYKEWIRLFFGSDQWLNARPDPDGSNWLFVFQELLAESERFDAAAKAHLLALPLPEGIDAEEAERFIDRWNRTFDYRLEGIRSLADVPPGMSTDFIPEDEFLLLTTNLHAVFLDSAVEGFADPFAGFQFHLNRYLAEDRNAVCAKVRLEITQEAVLARTGFEARLGMVNESGGPLEAVGVDLIIRDADGNRRDDLFGISVPGGGEPLTGLSSGGSLEPGAEASGRWRIVPSLDAAPDTEPVPYRVGGAIHYRVDGALVSIPMEESGIWVFPQPELVLNYYHERDVFANDPFTDVVEPSIPFSLGVLVTNRGFGTARNLSIVSGQPEIIENEKGLPLEIEIIGVETDGAVVEDSLTAEFGELKPGETKSAVWWLTSNLQGKFTDYEATFAHLDEFDDIRLSLIQEVSIHETLGAVRDLRPGGGSRLGFLVSDRFPVGPRPEEIHWRDGTVEEIAFAGNPLVGGAPSPGSLNVPLQTGPSDSWFYTRFHDPSGGNLPLRRVVRSDGREIPVGENAWVTDRTFRGLELTPVREHVIHLVDHGGGGNYTLIFGTDNFEDTTPPVSSVTALPADNYGRFVVEWSGEDAGGVASFDVLVSENGGPFTPWRTNTTSRSGLFYGEPGKTYAFYSVARDFSGNTESPPDEPQAVTTVNLENQPPTIDPITDQTVPERQVFRLAVGADDPDLPVQTLAYSLAGDIPSGMVIDAETGEITWATNENDGGREFDIKVRVTDDGWPPLAAEETFRLTVLEVNHPPSVLPVGQRSVHQDATLAFTLQAVDSDIPANQITFSLGSGSPAGAAVDPASGLFTWTPSREVEPGVYPFTVRATDDGVPPLSGERTFAVTVLPFRADLNIEFPDTVLTWTEGDAPALLAPGAAVTADEALDFGGGQITARFAEGGAAGDRLRFSPGPAGGALYSLDGNTILRDGIPLAVVSGGGMPGQPLRLDLNGPAGLAEVEELLRRLAVENLLRFPAAGFRVVEVEIIDSQGREATASRAVDIVPVNADPVILESPLLATSRDRPVDFSAGALLATVMDPDGDPLTVVLTPGATDEGGQVNLRPGGFRYQPPAGFAGWDAFGFEVEDPYGGLAGGNVLVWVRGPDDPAAEVFVAAGATGVRVAGIPRTRFQVEWSVFDEPLQTLGEVRLSQHGTAFLPGLPPGVNPVDMELWLFLLEPFMEILSGESFLLRAVATPGDPYRVEYSGDLTGWHLLEEGTVPAHGVIEAGDPAAAGFPGRFYRLITP